MDENLSNEKVQYEEVEIKKNIEKNITNDSYFDGSLIELIGYKVLVFIITLFTLGLAYPFGKCMLLSYRINHTVYNGKRLKFVGTGISLFVNYFKWIIFTIFTFGIYLFVLPVSKTKWIISNVHFEDEEYITSESFFDGNTLGLIFINTICKIINVITLGLLKPFTYCYKLKWIVKHTIINRKKIVFTGKSINLFLKRMLWSFLTIITFGIFGLWYGIKQTKWDTKNIHIKVTGEEEFKDDSLFIAIPIGIVILVILCILIPSLIASNSTEPDYNFVNEVKETIQNETRKEIINIYNSGNYNKDENYDLRNLKSLDKFDNIKGKYVFSINCHYTTHEDWMRSEYYEEEYARPVDLGCSTDTSRFISIVINYNKYQFVALYDTKGEYERFEWIYKNKKHIMNDIIYEFDYLRSEFERKF